LPCLQTLLQKYGEKGLAVIAVNTHPQEAGVMEFFEKNGLTMPHLKDENAALMADKFGFNGWPSTIFIDEDGRIMYYEFGFQKGDEVEIENKILKLLGE
jgi:peroxiredoxin